MWTVGLTGGIGSGKSAASALFEQFGICVVDADLVAREVVEPGTHALDKIVEHFGPDILDSHSVLNHSKLDRGKLRAIIFSDLVEKEWLESLLHPLIRDEIKKQLNNAYSPYAILVSPLLFETDQHKLVNRILLIDLPETLQRSRAAERDKSNTEQIQKIIDNQLSRECKIDKADDIISNMHDFAYLREEVERQHLHYLELAHEQ
jgi:dephospho-CoA kinase